MKVLIVGGAGYIGGTTALLFKKAGHDVVVLDNLSTGHRHNIPELELVEADAGDANAVSRVFGYRQFDAVLDFAAKIQVEESMHEPKMYFTNNSFDALTIVDEAVKAKVKNVILSSTAAVYGNPTLSPVTEDMAPNPLSPYGMSKFVTECMLRSYELSHGLKWTAFRYFNAAGAYGRVGPDYPFRTHLLPNVIHAQQHDQPIKIFGGDYDTPDGTCVRDYIHVADVARAHVMAAEQMVGGSHVNQVVNLGTSRGSSVLEIIDSVERISQKAVKRAAAKRRPGDAAMYYASNALAKKLFGWEPQKSLDDIVQDAITWQTKYDKAI